MKRKFLIVSSASGLLCVVLGAFGAHGLKALIAAEQLAAYETAVRYQFFHTFALMAVSLLLTKEVPPDAGLKRAGYAFIIGIILFCGSLYLLSTRSLIGIEMRWLGPVTPIGGGFFIIGWLMLFIYALKNKF